MDRGIEVLALDHFTQERAGAGMLWSSREDKAFVKSNEKENLVYHVRPKINIKGKIKILH